jgi:eukaryotic-like serine/threonine-protein kinase
MPSRYWESGQTRRATARSNSRDNRTIDSPTNASLRTLDLQHLERQYKGFIVQDSIEPDETISLAVPRSVLRCVCGSDVHLQGNHGECGKCGRKVSTAAFDVTQTLSFMSEGSTSWPNQISLERCDRSGERLGHFRLVSKLGEGGMGVVYRALDESLQRYVAVKVMRSSSEEGSSAAQVSRLLDEAVAQARLNHPHVVTIYFVGRDDAESFLAMELLPGPTLDKMLKDGPLPYSLVIKFARQVTSALALATKLNLVHGDIKPSNLILSCEQTIKLGDFGLAHTEQKTSAGISGTLNYMAPELSDGGSPSAQTDMYALGVTLFELTFGRRPYAVTGQTITDQLMSHRNAEVEFPEKWPEGVPERWRRVLERLLAKESQDRYPDYATLDADLHALSPVGVTRAGRLNRAMAVAVDYIGQLAVMSPFVLPALLLLPSMSNAPPSLANNFMQGGLILLGLLAPVIPAGMAWHEWKGWRTPGRYLFQLRVVGDHGLSLSRNKRLVRGIIRNGPIWLAAFTIVSLTLGLGSLGTLLGPVDELLLLINAVPILGPASRTMHDRICGSNVVLDTTRS